MSNQRAGDKPWGTRVVERREPLRLTQKQLAELCKPLTQQTISRIENNQIIPRDATKRKVAQNLGTTVDELFPPSDFDITETLVVKARKENERRAAQKRSLTRERASA